MQECGAGQTSRLVVHIPEVDMKQFFEEKQLKDTWMSVGYFFLQTGNIQQNIGSARISRLDQSHTLSAIARVVALMDSQTSSPQLFHLG